MAQPLQALLRGVSGSEALLRPLAHEDVCEHLKPWQNGADAANTGSSDQAGHLLSPGQQHSDKLAQEQADSFWLVTCQTLHLGQLQLIGADLKELNTWLPPNTVVLQLSDGLYAQPATLPDRALPPVTQPPSQGPSTPDRGLRPEADTPEMTAKEGGLLWRLTGKLGSTSDLAGMHTDTLRHGRPSSPASMHSPLRLRQGLNEELLLPRLPGSPRRTSGPAHQGSESGLERLSLLPAPARSPRGDVTRQVNLSELDGDMVALAGLQRECQEALQQRAAKSQELTQALDARHRVLNQRLRLDKARRRTQQLEQGGHQAQQHTAAKLAAAQLTQKILALQAGSLAKALEAAVAARQRLGTAVALLQGEHGAQRLRREHAALVGRQCWMVAQLGTIFQVRPRTVRLPEEPAGGFLEDRLERTWFAGSSVAGLSDEGALDDACSTTSGTSSAQGANVETMELRQELLEVAQLSIGGLHLEQLFGRAPGLQGLIQWEGTRPEERATGAALGYVAHLTHHLAIYLDVPLRFPLRLGNSHSWVLHHPPASSSISATVLALAPSNAAQYKGSHMFGHDRKQPDDSITAFPLFPEGNERTPFAYAIYLLNKDIEQLLDAHGLTASGPKHVLQNLHKLLAAAASALPPPAPPGMH
eukprot:jgi/Astpho2/5885/Aster-x0708